MVLYSNKRIEYYENETLESLKGMIDLKHLHRRLIQRSDKIPKKGQSIHGFKIITTKRTWYCSVDDSQLRDEWITTIRNLIDDKTDKSISTSTSTSIKASKPISIPKA